MRGYGFYKTADCQIQEVVSQSRQVNAFLKTAQEGKTEWRNLLNPIIFNAVSDVYKISKNPQDYVYLVVRAVAADEPNNNGDAFPEEELLRFSLDINDLVYRSFRNDPLHVNHWADDPAKAKGFLPDVHYVASDTEDHHVKTVVAVDRTKDPIFAEALRKGDIDTFSMGAQVAFTLCSICNNKAASEHEFCGHIRDGFKMQKIGSSLCYEKCYGVRFVELSQVGDPAWNKATTDEVLGTGAAPRYELRAKQQQDIEFPINKLGLSIEEANSASRYFDVKWDEMPRSMQNLARQLWATGGNK